jgi:hypothetical protein
MGRPACLAGLLLAVCGTASAADLTRIERRIGKEPAYASKSPRYTLLVLGPEAKDRVWLVKDGNVLYVDRNGNGDLTEPGEKLLAKKGSSAEAGATFEAHTLTVGGTTHYRLLVMFYPLKKLMVGRFARRADAQAVLKKDPQAEMLAGLALEVTAPHLKPKGRVQMVAGGLDLSGPLVPSATPAEAPIIHFGGPLQITFSDHRPTLRRNRATELQLVVGTPGLGAGTFAAVGYEDTIPASVHPKCAFTFPPAKAGAPPVKKLFELKERC